jgi:UDP-3-O-[3-hydroxymyristoyl] glucosamine N-acyltransferase
MGGRVGIADNLTIGAGAILVAGTGLISNVPPGETWGGSPGRPWREWLRGVVALERLAGRGRDGIRAAEESEE